MKALGKVLGLIFLGLLLLVVALGFALTQLFDPNDYKDASGKLDNAAYREAQVKALNAQNKSASSSPWMQAEKSSRPKKVAVFSKMLRRILKW